MFRLAHTPVVLGLVLVGCSSVPEGLDVVVGPEAPTTLDDLQVSFTVDRVPALFEVHASRTGATDETYDLDALEVEEVDGQTRYTLVIPARQTARDQVWTFEGVATYGNKTATGTGEVTILNTRPAATLRFEPENPTTLDTIRAVVDVDDPDDNPLQITYAWTINGEPFFLTGAEVPARATQRDDVIALSVEVRDTKDAADPIASQVIVQNIAPGEATAAIQPDPAAEDTPMTCAVVSPAVDPDGDEVSYLFAWSRNDRAWEGETTSTYFDGDTIPALITKAGELWSCTATPTDGTSDGPPATASVEIIPWAGPREFSTCGATGAKGPSAAQCASAYADTVVEDEVTIDAGKQIWTAATSGRFRIVAAGAAGGHGNPSGTPGKGAYAEGSFDLAIGDEIQIIVGQRGYGGTSSSGGGGGGTFVVRNGDDGLEPLLIAGGGGGTVSYSSNPGCGGNAEEGGSVGSRYDYFSDCTVKSSGLGKGGVLSANAYGSGGGGFDGDGADDYPGWDYGTGGKSFANGGLGGSAGIDFCGVDAPGGFGGGGAGNGGCTGGGGGGGYSGGDGGYLGGGGGSFNAGSDPVMVGDENDGPGWVMIDLE